MRAALAVLLLGCACWDFDAAFRATCPDPASGVCMASGDAGTTPDAGPAWQQVYGSTNGLPIHTVRAVSAQEVWFAGYDQTVDRSHLIQRFNDSFTEGELPDIVEAMTSTPSGVVFGGFYQAEGFTQHLMKGSRWSGGELPNIDHSYPDELLAVWAAGSQTWAAGLGDPQVFKNDVTNAPIAGPPDTIDIFAGEGIADDDFWVLGAAVSSGSEIFHHQGSSWGPHLEPAAGASYTAISAGGPDDVYVAGRGGLILHYHSDGGHEALDPGGSLELDGIYASGPGDVFAVGTDNGHSKQGVVVHWVDGGFEKTLVSPHGLGAVHGTSGSDVWAGDLDGGIWHYTP